MSLYTFNKNERLKSRKAIERLFSLGETLYCGSVVIRYQILPNEESRSHPVKCGVSVSKRKFRNATDRNLLKRRMREAYRLNKQPLIILAGQKELQIEMFLIYSLSEKKKYSEIEKGIIKGLQLIIQKTEKFPVDFNHESN